MQKVSNRIRNIFLTAILGIFLLLPLSCLPVQAFPGKTLIPKTKIEKSTEIKRVFAKFLKAMLLVGGSGVILFIVLYTYKRIKRNPNRGHSIDNIEKNLNTPETVDEATKFVIEKF